jgi:hypothetical protein
MMLSNYLAIGYSSIQSRKEGIVKQIGFDFMKGINKEVDIELSSEIENKLIEQMAAVLIQVNRGGKSENDNLTTK